MLNSPGRILPQSIHSPPQMFAFLCLAGAVSLVLVSIAASQILLAGAVAGFLWYSLRRRSAPRGIPGIFWPLAAFFLWTLLSALASSDIALNLGIVKKFFLFLIIFVVPLLAGGAGARLWIYRALFAVAALSAAAGLIQFGRDPARDALHRISGFLGHWMAFSGTLMLVLVALAAYALCCGLRRSWWAVPAGLIVAASILLSQTRNAILGAIAGVIIIILLQRHYRAVLGLIAILAAAYLVSPAAIQQRLRAGFDPNDPNTRNRIELFGTATRLIRDNLWFGVGPKSVGTQALRYRGNSEYPDWMYQHMHNNFLQIAAERGLPGLLLWLWFMFRLAWDSWVRFRHARRGAGAQSLESLMVSTAALGAWTALLVAGLFEYNFGDSEVLTLFLFMMSAPCAAEGPADALPAG